MRAPRDALAALYPGRIGDMPVAWHQMRIPGPPPEFALTDEERGHPDPDVRYARRTVQVLGAGGDRLALVDKASPHALHDLMVSGLATPPHPSPADVSPLTGQVLWRTASSFVRYVSRADVQRNLGLEGGRLHLALNCDPNTQDRESCQANKQFHLHLLYWTRPELAPLADTEELADIGDPLLRRQALDPLAFLGPRLAHECLHDLPLGDCRATLLPWREQEAIAGRVPLGCVIRLSGWDALDEPAFESLVREVHQRIAGLAADILAAFTGRREPPPPWHRHPLLPRGRVRANLDRLPLSAGTRRGLGVLARRLRDLPPGIGDRLRRGTGAWRRHHMTLNQPCYSLSIYTPATNRTARPLDDAPEVLLVLQAKLFSGIGGAGLPSLGGIPSVRIVRGEGTFSRDQWHHRARFQRDFARFNERRLAGMAGMTVEPMRRFAGTIRGWVDA
jgi:hypothetical protein